LVLRIIDEKMNISSWGQVCALDIFKINKKGREGRCAEMCSEYYKEGWSPSSLPNSVLVSLGGP